MDTILNNIPGENYFDTYALADFVSVCHHRCQQWSSSKNVIGKWDHLIFLYGPSIEIEFTLRK